jgi:hypothetical protein
VSTRYQRPRVPEGTLLWIDRQRLYIGRYLPIIDCYAVGGGDERIAASWIIEKAWAEQADEED